MKLKYITKIAIIFLLVTIFTHRLQAAQLNHSPTNFFSLTEIKNAQKVPIQQLEYAKATDGVNLAYRAYLPQQANAILIFYHGAGAHSGLIYNHIGVGLRDNFYIAVFTPDIRGHGSSGGERGDAPNVKQVWFDINTLIKKAKTLYPNLPVYIGGHSAGAGLALNYSSWEQKLKVDGYLFLSPYFGFRSETNYDEAENKGIDFSTVNTFDFIVNQISGGLFLGHSKAVKFNFPDEVLRNNPKIVPFNTVNMSNAVTPHSPDTQLSHLTQFGLWIGNQDEAFDPAKVIVFAQKHSNEHAVKEIKMINNENHFSIIVDAHRLIGQWLDKVVE